MKENIEAKVGLYARVSTEDQSKEGHSIEEQLVRLNEHCEYKGYKNITIYCDEGKSATSMKGRPEFQKMINDVSNGTINKVIIYKLDRLTRSIKDLEEILNLLEENNCTLESVNEEINTKNAYGMFFIRMVILLAQLEIEQIKERTIMGLVGTVKLGIPIGKMPFGYKKDIDNPEFKLKKRAIINEEEARIVRKIFNLYLKGYSYYYIAEKLKEEENSILKWRDSLIQSIINNRFYCGDIEHRKTLKNKETVIYKDVVPAIVSKDVFYDCQVLIEKNKHSFGGSLEYMFGKTLYCSKCGSLLCVSSNKEKNIRHYVCKKCRWHLNENKIEKELLEKLGDIAQFNMALTYNALMVDNDRLTEILNNVELDVPDERLKEHKNELRDLLDDMVINEINNKDNSKDKLWKDMNYEEKKSFVNSTIEAIYIDKIEGKTQQDYKVKIKNIKFKTSRINTFFRLINKGVIDLFCKNKTNIWSMAVIKDKKELDDYINRLRKRYKIDITEMNIRGDEWQSKTKSKELDDIIEKVVNNRKCFKTIKVPKNSEMLKGKFEKERHIHISLDS